MRARVRWLLALLAGLAFVGCGAPANDELMGEGACGELRLAGEPVPRNLVLIVSDTMRRDAMGAYGGRARTPSFDALARESWLFERAFTQAPWTKPSMATLFTSLFPSQHRVQGSPALPVLAHITKQPRAAVSDVLSDDLTTLAEVLKAAGYRTAGIVSNPWMSAELGFGQGFDFYEDDIARWNLPGHVVSEKARDWLQALPPGPPWFLYLHYMDAHRPHPQLDLADLAAHAEELDSDHRPLDDEARRIISGLVRLRGGRPATQAGVPASIALLEMTYHRGVERFDRALGAFLEALATHPDADETAVLVTSDHGEALFTRGYGNHGRGLYDDEVAVPLAARLPGAVGPGGADGGRVSCAVGLIDLLPTLCSYLGVPCPVAVFGRSLLALEPLTPRFVVSEGVSNQPAHRAIRNRSWKLLYEPGVTGDGSRRVSPYALFRLTDDPEESRDLLAAAPGAEAERARATLSQALRDAVPPFEAPEPVTLPLDPGLEQRLRALGYLGED